MLQTNRTGNSDAAPSEFRLATERLAEGVAFIRRRLSTILWTYLAALGIAVLYLVTAVPTFTAQADLVVDSKASPGDAASVSTIVESQIAIIKSESIARTVIGKLGLEKDPEFAGRDGVVRGMFRSISRLLGWSRSGTKSDGMQHAVESFERELSARRVGLTYVINITFDSADPERAAQILNTVAETYVAAQIDAKYKSALRGEKWVKDRINELSSRASIAQRAVANFHKDKNEIADSAGAVDAGAPPPTERTQGELRELEVAAESAARSYDSFLRALRYMEAQQQSLPVLEAHLLTEAVPPLRARSPKVGIVLGVATVGGALLGIAIGVLRDLSDRRIYASGQIWREFQIACIAVVPKVECGGAKLGATLDGGHALSSARSRNIVRNESPIWAVTDAPQSRFTESFLEIKLAIDSSNRSGKRNQVIGVTSTQPGEGKSTVAAALALLMADAGARVILVDCNLRNQSLSAALAPAAECGLLDVMSGAASVREATWIEPTTQLAFLPVGGSSRPIHANEVLASEILDEFFQSLRKAYEYVIVDLPAAAPFADVQAAACALDSFIFVVEAHRTNVDVVKRGLDVVRHENVVGIVLNEAMRRHMGALDA